MDTTNSIEIPAGHTLRSTSTVVGAHAYGTDASKRLVELDGTPLPIIDGKLQMVDSTEAIQAAIRGSLDVYFGPGIYFVRRLRFDRIGQKVTFAGGAVLCPIGDDAVVEVVASECVFRGLTIDQQPFEWGDPTAYAALDGSGASVRAVEFGIPRPELQKLILDVGKPSEPCATPTTANNTCFYDLHVNVSRPTDAAVRVWGVTKVGFIGGLLVGGAWGPRPTAGGGTGIRLGNEQIPTADAGAYEISFVGMTIREFRFAGVHFCATAPYDEPTFVACNIEQVGSAAILVRPFFPRVVVDGGSTIVRAATEVKCLNLIGCHFEGTPYGISVERGAMIRGGSIQGCRFGLYEKAAQERRLERGAMVHVDGASTVELTQAWSGPPPEGAEDPPAIPQVSTGIARRREWIISQLGSFAGEGVTPGTLSVPVCSFEQVHVTGNMLVGRGEQERGVYVWSVGERAILAGTNDVGNRWVGARLVSRVSDDLGLGFESPALGARRRLLEVVLDQLAVPAPALTAVPSIGRAGFLDVLGLPSMASVRALAGVVAELQQAFLALHHELRASGVLRKDTGNSSFT